MPIRTPRGRILQPRPEPVEGCATYARSWLDKLTLEPHSAGPPLTALIFCEQGVSIPLQGCGVRQSIDPGAYKTRTGAVPGRDRGLGHTAPTYIS